MENSTKLQRGGKTSGLTGLDNCLDNSDIDFPLLSSRFKDLNLQLHASTNVTNPYTFSIQGNTSFSAQLEPEVATYQIECEESTIRGIGITAIGYSSYGFAEEKAFGAISNNVFKNATIISLYVVLHAQQSPMWVIILAADVEDKITLKTSKYEVVIPKQDYINIGYRYVLNNSVDPNWIEGVTYTVTLNT